MEPSKNTTDEYLDKLPAAFRSLLESKEFEEDILSIGRKHGLHIDQLDILMISVRMFVLGVNSPETFKERLVEDFNLKPEEVNVLINELNSKVFSPLRDVLKEMNSKNIEENENSIDEIKKTSTQPQTSIKGVLTSNKLNQVVYSPQKTTDYSVERGATEVAKEEINKEQKKDDIDPYHEIIE